PQRAARARAGACPRPRICPGGRRRNRARSCRIIRHPFVRRPAPPAAPCHIGPHVHKETSVPTRTSPGTRLIILTRRLACAAVALAALVLISALLPSGMGRALRAASALAGECAAPGVASASLGSCPLPGGDPGVGVPTSPRPAVRFTQIT